ncbi:hypothetical protein NDU88_004617 [Pleurodeles waltl]|uniref:Uncharacterized protein n=1 Tax=Pleurodeles waltl TaxID=8319 RepID=A0AAV7QCT8_PLEWA|nr:hypothetical protein NDU88_004617 [Pleurodeles waltl]
MALGSSQGLTGSVAPAMLLEFQLAQTRSFGLQCDFAMVQCAHFAARPTSLGPQANLSRAPGDQACLAPLRLSLMAPYQACGPAGCRLCPSASSVSTRSTVSGGGSLLLAGITRAPKSTYLCSMGGESGKGPFGVLDTGAWPRAQQDHWDISVVSLWSPSVVFGARGKEPFSLKQMVKCIMNQCGFLFVLSRISASRISHVQWPSHAPLDLH